MPTIFNKYGNPISSSKNLRGIRRAVGTYPVQFVRINSYLDGSAIMKVEFKNGNFSVIAWDSFRFLIDSLRNWRNLYGVKIYIDNIARGLIDPKNEYLRIKYDGRT